MKNSKKGSSMVEATMIFPLVILTVVALIFLMTFQYNQVAQTTKLHIVLNAQVGRETETVINHNKIPENIKTYKGYKNFRKSYVGEDSVYFKKRGILTRNFSKPLEAYSYCTDEKKLIRVTDFFIEGDESEK